MFLGAIIYLFIHFFLKAPPVAEARPYSLGCVCHGFRILKRNLTEMIFGGDGLS